MLIPDAQIPTTALHTVMIQLLWAVVTGPLLLMFFNYAHQGWDQWTADLFAERHGLR